MSFARRVLFTVLLALYTYTFWLMVRITLPYTSLRPDVAFLAIKQDYVGMLHYRIAFFIHVFTAIFVLLAGYTQLSTSLRRRYRRVHQWGGWLYVVVTLALAGPSGLVLGYYANGGLSSRIAFCTLAVLWIAFTILAVVKLKQRRFAEHRHWMLRSFALALSAITLRAWKYLLVLLFHPHPMDVYRLVAWLGWTLNLAVAELFIRTQKKRRESLPI